MGLYEVFEDGCKMTSSNTYCLVAISKIFSDVQSVSSFEVCGKYYCRHNITGRVSFTSLNIIINAVKPYHSGHMYEQGIRFGPKFSKNMNNILWPPWKSGHLRSSASRTHLVVPKVSALYRFHRIIWFHVGSLHWYPCTPCL